VLRFASHHPPSKRPATPWMGYVDGVALVREKVRRALLALLLLAACQHESGDVNRGKEAIQRYGCNSCHNIPGIPGSKGMVGPPLDHMASRSLIGGKLPNNPQTMIEWLQNPTKFDPQASMPNLGVTAGDSRDIAAYLYTLK